MDQAISPEIKRRRKRKMIVKVSMIVVIGVGVFSFLVNMFQPKIRGAEVNFGVVDEGAVERFKNDFLETVGNDLNTSLGVTALYDVLKAGVNDATKRATLDSFDQVLGLELLSHADALKAQQAAPVEGAEEIEALIAKRLEAKRAKNWAEADAIRDQLRAMGVEIKDGKDGTTWTRI